MTLFMRIVATLLSLSFLDASISELLQQQNTRSMPVQMDMQTDDGITICTGDQRVVGCRDGANIAVTNAFWGRISEKVCPSDDGDPVTDCDGSPDTLAKVRGYCEGKKECELIAKHEKLQKNGSSHCPGVNKYLIVNYTCIPESKGVTLCQDVGTTLSCAAGWVMELADVFWGRRANSAAVCGDEEGIECDNSETASKYLKNKCNSRRTCHVKADPEVLSSKKSTPCNSKYLMVNYICRPPTMTDLDAQRSIKEESKELRDSTSKELMGLLEKHLTEIKEPKKETPVANAIQALPQPIQPIRSVNPPAPGISAGFTRSMEEEKPSKSDVKSESKSDVKTTSEKVKGKSSDSENASSDDDSMSVRSILSRAKDILKTLDTDNSETLIKKRQDIARPTYKKKNTRVPMKITTKSAVQRKTSTQRRSNIPNVHIENKYPESFHLRSWYEK